MYHLVSKAPRSFCARGAGQQISSLLLVVLSSCVLASLAVGVEAATTPAASLHRSLRGPCGVSEWGPWTPCTRTGLHQWAHSHSRSVLQPAVDCPALTETQTCEVDHLSMPADAAAAAHQATTSLLINLPLAVSVGLSFPSAAPASSTLPTVTPELAAALAAGRKLWRQQASRMDQLQCSSFNGPVELLRGAAEPVVGTHSAPQIQPTESSLIAARAAFAATAKAVAVQAAAAARSRTKAHPASVLEHFRRAILRPLGPGQHGSEGSVGVLPDPAADATADAHWFGGDSVSIALQPGPTMSAAAAHTANEALLDGMANMVPWLTVKDTMPAQQQPAASMHLNMTYDQSQQAATFNAIEQPEGSTHSHGHLLLSIQNHLTGIYGLEVTTNSSTSSLLNLPTTDAVLRTNAGGGVSQLALSLAGTWTQANLTAALGLQQPASQQQQEASTFTIKEPAVLFSAAPSALYVALQTDVASLGVQDAPATINLRPGGAAALTLFEPCQPVPGLQLSDVELHLEPEGNLTGVATGTLASTAVSALATVTPTAATANGRGVSGAAATDADQDLALVMTAGTVGAGKLADVITIITKRPPVKLLQALRQEEQQPQQQQQQRMQFSSVTLTYSSPRARRRGNSGVVPREDDESEDSGFNMVAVPDVNAAPALKQMLDAVGLQHDSLTLRTSSLSGVGSAFGLAAEQPFRLQLPAPFTAAGPTVLTLQVGGKSSDEAGASDALIKTALAGTTTAGLQLPGLTGPVAMDLSAVTITTPTAIVGASGLNSSPAPVTAALEGRTLSPVALNGFSFLQFGSMNISATTGFQPSQLKDLTLSGPLTAFGVAGTASFSTSSRGVVQQEGSQAVQLSAYLPSLDLPMLARSMGANMSLGAVGADLQSFRVQFSPEGRKAAPAGARNSQDQGSLPLSVSAELRMLGMSSYVSFDMSAEQGASIAASFVAGQINRVVMPSLLPAVASSLEAARRTVDAAAAAVRSGQAAPNSLVDDAREEVNRARTQLDEASTAFNLANQKAVSRLQDAAAAAESAAAVYNAARSQSGAALAQAHDEFNTADTAFNRAKTLSYKSLNTAQQTYKDALAAHQTAVSTAQQRVDTLLMQTLQLRADYNTANMLCTPAPDALQHCKAAASAWMQYQSASAALDSAETALQEAATVGPSAQKLQRAKSNFVAIQAAANDVITGGEWATRAAAAAKLQAATAALHEAEKGRVAQSLQAANAALVQAQEQSRALLSMTAQELRAVSEAKHALKAARTGLKTATAAVRLSLEELTEASQDLSSLLAQITEQVTALTQNPTASAAGLVRVDQINVGVGLEPGSPSVLMGISYDGAVRSGSQQKALSGRLFMDVSDSSEEFGVMLHGVLRDSVLDAFRTLHRSLAALL